MTRFGLPLLVLVAACGQEPAVAPDSAAATQAAARAEQAAAALMMELLGKLMAAMREGPPEQALNVCADVAQDLTAKLSKQHGVQIRRSALRLRNPKNAPDEYERKWMERVATRKDVPHGGESAIVGNELRFVRPIFLGEVCAKCHGENVSDAVQGALKKRYPEDKATGFKPGDFRGIVSVRVPLSE
ncbi:MAG: Tll0287-like domain-containing protein [Planctomycetota bacterium]|jgi:hypothetical protein